MSKSPLVFTVILLLKVVLLQNFGVVLLPGHTVIFAIVFFSHRRNKVQAARMHLQARTFLTFMIPDVLSVIGLYWTGQIEGDTLRDFMNCS